MYDASFWQHVMYPNGETTRTNDVFLARRDFLNAAVNLPSYVADATRNNATQPFVIERSDSIYKAKIIALPGDSLNQGDYIVAYGETWLVYQVRANSPIQKSGVLWLCNHVFRWQNASPEIIVRPGVLDSGVYSTTERGNNSVMSTDKQFKVYLPYDSDTRKLFVDKRLAIAKSFDAQGNEILLTYRVTGYDPDGLSYGGGSNLLVLNIRSASDYSAQSDSLTHMICDYIPPADGSLPAPIEDVGACTILGGLTIRIGSSRTYEAAFRNAQMDEVVGAPVWTVGEVGGVVTRQEDGRLVVSVEDSPSLIGSSIHIEVHDANNIASSATMEVLIR